MRPCRRLLAVATLLAAAVVAAGDAPVRQKLAPGTLSAAQRAAGVRDLCGGQARLVWLRQVEPPARSPVNRIGPGRHLVGFDSATASEVVLYTRTEHALVHPRFTHDGDRVVFSVQEQGKEPATWVVDWTGGNLREVGPGIALDVRRDAQGREIAYARIAKDPDDGPCELWAVPIDAPQERRKLCDHVPISGWRGFTVSADGRVGGGVLHDPRMGVLDLTQSNGAFAVFSGGCYGNLAPDNSYRFFHFMGGHTGILLFENGWTRSREVRVSNVTTHTDIPGCDAKQRFAFLHPKWSHNHPRHLVMTGPYTGADGHPPSSLPIVEVYLGRFSPDYSAVEAWTQVTSDDRCDLWPDAWIAGAPAPGPGAPIDVARALWPRGGDAGGVVFAWQAFNATNAWGKPGRNGAPTITSVTARGKAVPGVAFGMDAGGGSFVADAAANGLVGRGWGGGGKGQSTAAAIECVLWVPGAQDGAVIDCGGNGPRLAQRGLHLIFSVGGASVDLGAITANAWHVVQCGIDGDKAFAWIDDEDRRPGSAAPDWAAVKAGGLTVGDGAWRGRVDHLCLRSKLPRGDDLAASRGVLRQRVAARGTIARVQVEAELVAETAAPKPADLNAYVRALTTATWKVRRTISGAAPGGVIAVRHWAVLDRAVVRTPPRPGTVAVLDLEAWQDHPELASELTVENDDLDAPLFVDVGPR